MAPALRKFAVLVAKDVVLETRQFDTGILMIGFGAMEVLLFVFVMGSQRSTWLPFGSGILWMGFLFAGMLSVTRLYAREASEDVQVGIDLAPGGRLAVFWAKICVGFFYVAVLEAMVSLLTWHLTGGIHAHGALFGLVLALGAVGIVAVGTMMSAVETGLSGQHPLLAVFVMALEVPLAISSVQATLALHQGHRPWLWIHGLMAYDAIFLTLPVVLYEWLWEV